MLFWDNPCIYICVVLDLWLLLCGTCTSFVVFAVTDGDGKVELTVAYSDRVVRCFRWSTVQDPETEEVTNNLIQIQKWQLAGQVKIHLTKEKNL